MTWTPADILNETLDALNDLHESDSRALREGWNTTLQVMDSVNNHNHPIGKHYAKLALEEYFFMIEKVLKACLKSNQIHPLDFRDSTKS